MSNQQAIEAAAQLLRTAAENNAYCEPVRTLIGADAIQDAYAVQEINHQYRIQKGARLVGRKIGLTSPLVQLQLGVNQPDYGMLYHDMDIPSGGEISMKELMQPKAEGELAFLLGKDLDNPLMIAADVIRAIDWVIPAIEIPGSRIKGWDIKITDTIADNASASHFILGHQVKKLHQVDVLQCDMRMFKNGEKVSEGKGADCLGSPISATLWLAKLMAQLGQPLRAGEIVLSGALGPMTDLQAGDHIELTFEGLGSASVKIDS